MAKQRGNQNPYVLPLCCLFFFDIRILITPLVSFGHCVVCSSSIYRFWLPLWYLVVIVLSVLLRYTDSDYPFGILWPLCCLFFFDIRILITPLFGHCVVCSLIYKFWLPLWYLLVIVLSLLLRYTDSDYPFGILWPLCCLFFFDIRILKEEEQTTQWSQDTKGVIRIRISKKERQHNDQKIPKE
jgi:hypothetical protein